MQELRVGDVGGPCRPEQLEIFPFRKIVSTRSQCSPQTPVNWPRPLTSRNFMLHTSLCSLPANLQSPCLEHASSNHLGHRADPHANNLIFRVLPMPS